MKKSIFIAFGALAALSLGSCCHSNCDNKEEVTEGRISTHTRQSHVVHQQITPEERELAKEHITNATAPGVSTVSISDEGAQIINQHRANQNCDK